VWSVAKHQSGIEKCYVSHFFKKLFDLLFVFGYIVAARLFAALSTFQVIGGIDALALRTGIVSRNILKPVLIAHSPDPLQVIPKLDPMRSFRLKLFKISAGVLPAFNTKIYSSFSGAGEHFTCLAIRPSFGRPTSVTLNRFLCKLESCRQPLKPYRVFLGSDEQSACLTVKAAYTG
jgi:hypothetical protein